jgi:hypothetical protein
MQEARFKKLEPENQFLGSPCKIGDLAWEMKRNGLGRRLSFAKGLFQTFPKF